MIDDNRFLTRREYVIAAITGFILGASTAEDGTTNIPAATASYGPESYHTGEIEVVVSNTLERAESKVSSYPALLFITDGNWFIEEEEQTNGTIQINSENSDMEIVIANTLDDAQSQVDTYPTLALARSGNSAIITEE